MLQQFLLQYQNTYSVNLRPKYLRTGNPWYNRCHPGLLSSKDPWVTKYRPLVVFTRSYWNKRDYCFFSKMSFGCETGNLSILTLSKLHPPIIMWITNSLGELAYFALFCPTQTGHKMSLKWTISRKHIRTQTTIVWIHVQVHLRNLTTRRTVFLTCPTQCDC